MNHSKKYQLDLLLKKEKDTLIDFLLKNSCHFNKAKDVLDYLKRIEIVGSNGADITIHYPKADKKDFLESSGIELSVLDEGSGSKVHIGKISLSFTFDIDSKVLNSYSLKFWYLNNSYKFCDKSGNVCKDEVYNFRFEYDQNHGYHAHILHQNPRLERKKSYLTDFFKFIEGEVLPLTRVISLNLSSHSHIGETNRLRSQLVVEA